MKRLIAIFAVLVTTTLATATLSFAQGKSKEPTERSLSGVVSDDASKPAIGAVVQIKNMKTLQVRSFIARDKGDYYFSGLSRDVDYEISADFNGGTSGTKKLSTFDTKTDPVINLQVKAKTK